MYLKACNINDVVICTLNQAPEHGSLLCHNNQIFTYLNSSDYDMKSDTVFYKFRLVETEILAAVEPQSDGCYLLDYKSKNDILEAAKLEFELLADKLVNLSYEAFAEYILIRVIVGSCRSKVINYSKNWESVDRVKTLTEIIKWVGEIEEQDKNNSVPILRLREER